MTPSTLPIPRWQQLRLICADYAALTKPRVTQLAVFCAVIGMFLATPTLPAWQPVLAATLGIWLLAGAAFAVNCLIEQRVDAQMARTRARPLARGAISPRQALTFSAVLGGLGMSVLYWWVNPLTMWLTFATFVGYALIYTIILKPHTPQNIVIGGYHQQRARRSLDSGADYFYWDAPAFLGARFISTARV